MLSHLLFVVFMDKCAWDVGVGEGATEMLM